MAYNDWTHDGDAGTTTLLSTDTNTDGSSCLKCKSSGNEAYEILSQSISDSPSEGRITSNHYATNDYYRESVGVWVFRYQDLDNYYEVSHYGNNTNTRLYKISNGNKNKIDATSFDTQANDIENTWRDFEIKFWNDDGGDFRVRFSINDGSGYSKIGDLVDTSPSWDSGGGIGVSSYGEYRHYYDETEIYY